MEKGGTTAYSSNEFYEGGIDLTALNGGVTPCLSSFLAETRSSSAITATLKDFALGGFQTCHARISLSPLTATNAINQPHKITATVQYQQGAGTFANAPDGSTVNLTLANTNGAGASFCTDSTCNTLVTTGTPAGSATTCTVASGQCFVYLKSSTAGTITINANSTFTVGGQSLSASTTDPINLTRGGTGPATKTYVDGYITITPAQAVNVSGATHTLTATVYKNTGDGAGYVLAGGRNVTFTLLNNNNGATFVNSVSTCTTASSGNALGTCTVQISTTGVGTVSIQASSTFDSSVFPGLPTAQNFTRTTGDSVGQDSVNGNKSYVNGRIYILPHGPTNPVGTPEAFTIHVQVATSQTNAVPNWVAAPVGTTVSYNLTSTLADASFVANGTSGPACPATPYSTGNPTPLTGTTDAAGTLTVTVLSCNAGTITVHASVAFSSTQFPGLPAAQNFTRSTSDAANTALGDTATCSADTTSTGSNCFSDAVKTYKSGSIQVEKTVELGQFTPAPNICFTITTVAPSTVLIVDGAVVAQNGTANELCFSGWTAASGTSGVSLPHTYKWSGLASGTYHVVENTPAFPYNQNPPDVPYDSANNGYANGIVVNAVTGTFPIDLTPSAPWTNPLVKGALDVQKNFNGVVEPVTGTQFSFTITQCSAGSAGTIGGGGTGTCTTTATTFALTVPGCNWDVSTGAQPTSCTPRVNPVRVSGLTEGYYKIVENPKTGFSTDPTVYVVQVFAGNNLTGGAGVPLTTFNNVQRFRVVAFACDMLTPSSLHPSSVSLATGDTRGTQSGTTLSGADLTAWNTAEGVNITQDQLCHLESSPSTDDGRTNQGGNFPGLAPTTGSYAPAIGPLP
jgi:hypothetical protein